MDDKQIHHRQPGYRTATVVDVLYADDCVLFTNTVRAMQTMMIVFDEVASAFGMELALNKTKIVCNQYSKAMEIEDIEAREKERETAPEATQHNTRSNAQRKAARLQIDDITLFVPSITIRGVTIEVVPHFKYLGLMDTEDGALGMEIQVRICRMKQRFKEFEGRIFCNQDIGTLARMQVFKCMVMTNGIYASEVWNFNRVEIDRLEKHYFRLMRNTLLMRKYDTTYCEVLQTAREQGAINVYPLECYIQRQQLKFIWKLLHLEDTALQKIVLHGKMDPQYSQGRGGRKRTYKQCVKEALDTFNVTMEQCLQLEQREWDAIVEGTGLESAMRQWEDRPKARKAIDVDWRGKKTPRSKKQRSSANRLDEQQTELDMLVVETDEDVDVNSDTESETDDEFAHFANGPEEMETSVDIERPPRGDAGAAALHEDQVSQGATTRARTSSWIKTYRGVVCASQGLDDDGVERDQTGTTGSSSGLYSQRLENLDSRRVAEATPQDRNSTKCKTATRHAKRDRKRARETDISSSAEQYRHQQTLQMIVGEEANVFLHADNSAVPWEHRGILGHTGARRGTEGAST